MGNVGDRSPSLEWDGHLLLLSRSEAEQLAGLARWVRRGLDQGDKILFAQASCQEPKPALDFLHVQGVDVAAAMAEGRLATIPITSLYPDGGPDAIVDQALAEGFRSVRMTGEVAAARVDPALSAHLDLEGKLDRLCRTRSVSALCRYTRSTAEREVLPDLVAVHGYRLRDSALCIEASDRGLVVGGEIDRANADVLAAALSVVSACADREVWLDLAALEFIDVAACRELVYSGQEFRQAGGRVILAGAQPEVGWTLRLLGVDEFAGIDLVGGEP
jgi:anti-anti-sigma factor